MLGISTTTHRPRQSLGCSNLQRRMSDPIRHVRPSESEEAHHRNQIPSSFCLLANKSPPIVVFVDGKEYTIFHRKIPLSRKNKSPLVSIGGDVKTYRAAN
jgi:hypothetical protein